MHRDPVSVVCRQFDRSLGVCRARVSCGNKLSCRVGSRNKVVGACARVDKGGEVDVIGDTGDGFSVPLVVVERGGVCKEEESARAVK